MVVRGITPGGTWTLDADSIATFAAQREESKAFHFAIDQCDPIQANIPDIGKVELYVNVDRSLSKKLHTVTMRRPLMKIDTFRHNVISAKYAAILVCADDPGNKLLRQLEPPQHTHWDPARYPVPGKRAIQSMKLFVKDELRKIVTEKAGSRSKLKASPSFYRFPTLV